MVEQLFSYWVIHAIDGDWPMQMYSIFYHLDPEGQLYWSQKISHMWMMVCSNTGTRAQIKFPQDYD